MVYFYGMRTSPSFHSHHCRLDLPWIVCSTTRHVLSMFDGQPTVERCQLLSNDIYSHLNIRKHPKPGFPYINGAHQVLTKYPINNCFGLVLRNILLLPLSKRW